MSHEAILFYAIIAIILLVEIYAMSWDKKTKNLRMEIISLRQRLAESQMSDEARLCALQLSTGSIYCQSEQAAALDAKIKARNKLAIDAARWHEAKNWMFINYDTSIPPRNLIYSCTLKPSSMPSVSSPQTDIAEVFQAAFERDIDIEISKQKKLNINSLSATIKFQDGSTIKTDGYVEDETASNDDISVR